MRKTIFFFAVIFLTLPFSSFGELALNDRDILAFQMDISREVTENISKIFQDFSDGNIEADAALTKTVVLKNTYLNSAGHIGPECEKLNELMKKLFSQIENYFIFFKRTNRENPDINIQIAETRYEIAKEAARLDYLEEEEYGAY